MKELEKIATFLGKHHVLSLATHNEDGVYCANLFYVYDKDRRVIIVASDEKTKHIQDLAYSLHVAGSVVLETETIGKIEGLQFRGTMFKSEETLDSKLYFKRFSYARIMQANLFTISLTWMKLTDNSLGFGKKLIWKI